MMRTRHAAALVVLPVLLALGACAGRAGAGPQPTTGPAQRAEIAARVEGSGVDPDLVYVTDVDGYTLATQSVGVVGDVGMSAYYVREAGGTVMLATSWDPTPSVAPCAELPDSAPAVPGCTVRRGDVHVLLQGEDVDAATLRAAGEAVRVPRADELADLFRDLQVAGPPVERGDLPPHGEGAPVDPPALGG
ncbi:membrane lipoprotein [Cellulomonas shaoxiangyii]|uniref:Membrane lipoprotein n=1 Tax=Cellulomonas shaoxiangyii TaxID=2566013 RepID=A0A4P7SMJ7_9CELL|nr:membrane lipoprotein [Cellulomonas shaoxiangyii]QCB94797.1 membrane lipoprotein [Cellulomonas shaoxiangyii]TGY86527.1 membrane lipoprotein [Cellulomonas shaoxiangyii]